tara:strand:+ start:57 stop:614 length:558 start_codon:yes stop_codon:yes gene_type:complete
MNLEELKKEISKPHNDFDQIPDQLSEGLNYEGIYAISIDVSQISGCLLYCLKENNDNESVIYIGKGNVLSSRLGQELKAEGAGIFFRKFGSYLNYICSEERCSHEKNYKFSYEDENSIKREIMLNLKLKTFEVSQHHEKKLIQHFHPPFNFTHNKDEHGKNQMCEEVKQKHRNNYYLNKEYYRNK